MSDVEEEYEVESILRAKVVKKGLRKIWHYYVQWKGYDQDANTWEPFESFEGSEHFVKAFWERIGGNRDHTRMDLFKIGEEIFPVGPPGRRKSTKKAESEIRASPRRPPPLKRKPTDSEGEVQSLIDEDVEEIVTRPVSSRKRRTSNEQAAEPPAKRRRGSAPIVVVDTDEEESISKAPSPNRRTRASTSARQVAEPSISDRVTRSSASPRKTPAKSQSATQERRRIQPRQPSTEVIEIDSDEPAEATDETSHSNLADESGHSTPTEEPVVARTRRANGSAKTSTHPLRPTRSLIEPSAEVVATENDIARPAKTRSARKQGSSTVQVPSTSNGAQPSVAPRAKISGARAGPGRSSKGIVVDSTSQLPETKGSSRPGQKRVDTPVRPTPGHPVRKITPHSRAESADVMAVDDQILPPLTNEDLDRLAALNQPTAGTLAPIPAGDAPNHDETSDRDAEGEVDHDFLDYVDVAKPPSTLVPEAKAEAHGSISLDQAANEFESLKVMLEEPEPVLPPAPKEPLINPIDAPLGNGNARSSSSFAAWKKYTIFDKPFAGPSEQSPISPLAEQPETASLALLILINASVRIPVILKDIHPSTNSTRKRLDEVTAEVQSMSQGAPGKFYKGQAVADVIKALICGGSNARVVLQEGVDANVKESFDRFNSRLKDGSLFVAVFGSQVLAFCSSESSELVAKLGASPNLVGLGENVLVSEVLIGDDSAYIDAIMNAKDEPW